MARPIWAYTYQGVAGTNYRRVFKSDDGGSSWDLDYQYIGGDSNPWKESRTFDGTASGKQWIAASDLGVWYRATPDDPFSAVLTPANTYFLTLFVLDADHVWAGGYSNVTFKALLWFWNGSTWTDLSAALVAAGVNPEYVTSIWAGSANDIWIAGVDGTNDAFVIHYDGVSTWTDRTPGGGGRVWEAITSIYGFASDDVWITVDDHNDTVRQWTGSGWVSRHDVNLDAVGDAFTYLAGLSSTDLWMSSKWTEYLAHWNGSAWTAFSPSILGNQDNSNGLFQFGDTPTDLFGILDALTNSGYNMIQSAQPPITSWNGSTLPFASPADWAGSVDGLLLGPPVPTPPIVENESPAPDDTGVDPYSDIRLDVYDADSGVDPDSVIIKINGVAAWQDRAERNGWSGSETEMEGGKRYRYRLRPPGTFKPGSEVTISVDASDLDGTPIS